MLVTLKKAELATRATWPAGTVRARLVDRVRGDHRWIDGGLSPATLILDEIGYLPLDKTGAELLFQIISQRCERGSINLTTNKAFKQGPSIFNNDAGITSAILDRLLHQAQAVVIKAKSYRMNDQVEPPD
jgi:hypothetical protein